MASDVRVPFLSLTPGEDADALRAAVNRVIEDINHRFTLDVLTRDFRSNDLGVSAHNLRSDRDHPDESGDRVVGGESGDAAISPVAGQCARG